MKRAYSICSIFSISRFMAQKGAARRFINGYAIYVAVFVMLAVFPIRTTSLLEAQIAGNLSGGTATGAVQGATGTAQGATGSLSTTSDNIYKKDNIAIPEATERAKIAMATVDYPVTPGDVYLLSYLLGSQTQSLQVIVDGDGTVNLGFLGKLSTSGMTFRSFKTLIENKVEAAYPKSSPSLIIISTGIFPVPINGQVQTSSVVTVWGLTRLSAVVNTGLTPYSSLRDVQIASLDGKVSTYDLFKAGREGDLSQDPYMRPGDVVTVKRADRVVKLEGEVLRPGTYQLLEGEGIRELISYYGDGLGVSAKSDMVVLTRSASEGKPESESVVFDFPSLALLVNTTMSLFALTPRPSP